MKLVKLPLYLLVWVLRFAVELPLWLLGLVLVPIMAATGFYYERDSLYYTDEKKPRRVLAWRGGWLTWLWGNEEDGIDGRYFALNGFLSDGGPLVRIIRWAALRNPVSNLRYVPLLNVKLDPARIEGSGDSYPETLLRAWRRLGGGLGPPFWSFAAQGPYAGFALKWPFSKTRHFEFQIGYKIYPGDANAKPWSFINTSRWPFCGIGLQLRIRREIRL